MSESVEEQPRPGEGKAASGSATASGTVSAPTTTARSTSDGVAKSSMESSVVGASQAVLGPFTVREVVFGVGVLVMFLGTLLPFVDGRVLYTTFWSTASLFFVGIGILLPIVALALIAGRRLGSSGLRVGSLSVDQFASVTAVLAATFFFLQTVTAFHSGAFLALVGSLGLLAATVVGRLLPKIKDDFTDRPEIAAHPLARPITAARPKPPKPAKAAKPVVDDDEGFDSGSIASASSSASPSVSRADSKSGHPSAGYGDGTDGTGPRVAGPGSGGVAGASIVSEGSSATRSFGKSKDSAAASRDRTTARTSSAARSDAPAETSSQAGSELPQSSVQAVTTADDDRASARAVGTPSNKRGTGQGATSAAGPSRTPDTKAAVDRVGSSEGPTLDETQIHEPVRDGTTTNAGSAGERVRQEPITATRSAEEEPVVEAFWFAVGSARPVFDENTGREIFVLQPGDWEVGIEDRGRDFLVQDKRSGAVGVLRDLRNIERAPRD